MYSILIADDHPLVLLGIKTFLELRGYYISGVCSNGIEAYNQIMVRQPNLAFLDVYMPGMTGLEVAGKLNEQRSQTAVILITGQSNVSIVDSARDLKVRGYLIKKFAVGEIDKCIHEVMKGRSYFSVYGCESPQKEDNLESSDNRDRYALTRMENKVLDLVAAQKSTKEIARLLFISEKTVETHRSHIIKKLNIPGKKNALLMWAIRQG